MCLMCTHNDDCEKVKSGGYRYDYGGYGTGCSRCNNCMGTGVVSERNCRRCSGTGEVDVVEEVDEVIL